jgi:hypothetical protein
VRRDAAQAKRIAIGLGFGEHVHADITAGAAAILDDPLLPVSSLILAQNRRDRVSVGPPAG